MLDDLWFVAEGGVSTGPFTSAEVQARLNDGRFAGALVWKPGHSDWQPIDTFFSVTELSAAPASEPDPELSPSARSAGRVTAFVLVILTLCVSALSFLLFGEGVNFHRFGDAAAFVYAGVWVGAVVMVLTAAILAWRRADIPGERWPWQMAKAVSAIAVIGALAFSVVFVRVTTTIHHVSEARRAFGDYQLAYDPVTRTISFEGPIGPGFADDLERLLNVNADVRVLHIVNSPGGLIDEALAAAETIEQYPNLATEVSIECNSACFALFAAARHRRAEYRAEFGFHRSDLVTEVPAFARDAADGGGREFRDYVIGRGLRAEFYDEWARNEEMRAVSAIELNDIGLVENVMSEGVVIEASTARWRWIAALSVDAKDGFSELAEALADSREPSLLAASRPIFAAARSGDMNALRSQVAGLVPNLLPKVLESGEPAAVLAYLEASRNSIGYLVSMEQWDVCASIVDGRGSPDGAIPTSFVRTELVALADAVRSAAATQWISRPPPSWAQSAGQQAINSTIVNAVGDGIDNTRYDSDPRVRCLLTHRLLGTIQRGDPVRSIVAYRWILAQD